MATRGRLTLVFDDGYEHILKDIVPLLNQRHFVGVFAIPTEPPHSLLDGQPLAPLSHWQPIRQHGHELAAHSATHADLTTLSSQQLAYELSSPARRLPATTLIYPGGAYNDTVVAAAQPYYRLARTVTKGFESLVPPDPMRLKTYNFTRQNFSVLKANLLAFWACITNTWLIETYHIVTDQPTSSTHAITRSGFIRHLDFLASLPIRITTLQNNL